MESITVPSLYHKDPNQKYQYGTAGFRLIASLLPPVLFRIGCLAVLRSLVKGGAYVGVMITASHNPEQDNGVKLVDTDGEVLPLEWEGYAEQLSNLSDSDFGSGLASLAKTLELSNVQGRIIIGRDTRSSSSTLSKAAIDGVEALNGAVIDLGEVTTPQLHWAVYRKNRNEAFDPVAYIDWFSSAFKRSLVGAIPTDIPTVIDCSNGVGAQAAKSFVKALESVHRFEIINDSRVNLNFGVGADFVKSKQKIPAGVDPQKDRLKKFVSIDGDADRLIYFYIDESGNFRLLDGDRILSLYALYFSEVIGNLSLKDFTIGIVQTAYANGASTDFVSQTLKLPIHCTPTGVKYLHRKAQEFDLGIYFEANGHGTLTLSKKGLATLEDLDLKWKDDPDVPQQKKDCLSRLLSIFTLINPCIGDALGDMLLVETILRHKKWTLGDWYNLYVDLPNTLIAQKVKDRMLIKTTDAERRVSAPLGLQEKIDALVSKFRRGRSFVRPSGTEDIVRIYAEAETKEGADALASGVALAVCDVLDALS
eukprot:TRINITY_DN1254_c0_g1_i1.p1 TRINITY_DN1254_c0_g1~~TRINITY_DN1254_c0_g1_i1.p1  ORF type:complete len:535 (-),score=76.77 TRINITY_DN1254_c0_g1_i1:109-1713(-)